MTAFADEFVTIHCGDCRDVMRSMDADSIDAIVTDQFMGSCSTLKAARAEGHRSIGIDLEHEYCEIA